MSRGDAGDGRGAASAARVYGRSAQQLQENLGAHLRAARVERRLTLSEVASRAGLTKGFLSQLERAPDVLDRITRTVPTLAGKCHVVLLETPRRCPCGALASTVHPATRMCATGRD